MKISPVREKIEIITIRDIKMKISILGAGPAGSTAAYYLAKEGIDVELIDSAEFPRDKPCAGGLFNPQLFYREFPYIEEVKGKYIHTVKFYCGRYSAEYTSPIPLLKMVLRRDFDHFLLKKAVKEGARFFTGKTPEGDILITTTGAKRAHDYPQAGICLVNNFPTKEDINTVHIHYAFKGIKGYCWLYPKNGYANIGIGAYMPQKNIRALYEEYIDFLHAQNIISVHGRSYRAKIIPFGPVKRFYTENSLIAGDAAGFVNPSTGEGIYFAMLSGKIAARTIIEKHKLSWYEQQCRNAFGEYLKPTMLGRTRFLLNKVLEKAVYISGQDNVFLKMLAENFFRLGNHRLSGRFLTNIGRI